MNIDWSKAPEWADAHGDVHCITTRNIWFNDNVYMYVGDSRSYQWMDLSSDLIHNHGRRSVTNIQARPVPWTGEGLPPVGVACEIRHGGWASGHWQAVTIKYISSEYLIAGEGSFKREQHFHMPDIEFRPIRTPEQIAADERLHRVRNALTAIHAGDHKFPNDLVRGNIIAATVEAMIDAGYRKLEIVEN